jgi:hypothetical protein
MFLGSWKDFIILLQTSQALEVLRRGSRAYSNGRFPCEAR